MIFSFAILYLSILSMLSTTGQIVFLAAALVWFVFANGRAYKYRFPGMEGYYDGKKVSEADIKDSLLIPAGQLELLDNREVLDRWKASIQACRAAGSRKKPKLILIATTGGAYRAAFWTTMVLDHLGEYLEGDGSRCGRPRGEFHRHVRLITGASGGMVGAAYYVSAFDESGPPDGSITDVMRRETGLDSLTPVIRRLVLRDLPLALWPRDQTLDRGIELERQWTSLGRTFPDLSEGEREGWRPSLIVSPMIVESGRRLLVSNLDLSSLAETRPLGNGRVAGPACPSVERARPYSSSAVEFFRIFRRSPARLLAPDGHPDERDVPARLPRGQPAHRGPSARGRRRIL